MTLKLTRRDFLKLSSVSLLGSRGSVGFPSKMLRTKHQQDTSQRWARVSADYVGLRSRPSPDGKFLGFLYYDDVVPVYRDVVGQGWFPHNHVWFETPDGLAYSASMQPVENVLNKPTPIIPSHGLFGEVSVPYTDARITPNSDGELAYRLYYAGVFLVDRAVKASDGEWWYHIKDDAGHILWIDAQALRLLAPEDIEPLSPDVEDKHIQVNLEHQILSAFEGRSEVFRTSISSGRGYIQDGQWVQAQSTPTTSSPIWSKRVTRHMEGGTADTGWDLPGVGWVAYFASNGAAIHATYWHNHFGRAQSAGCINCTPEAARWVFRWSTPIVDYVPGNVTEKWPGGTRVTITSSA